MLKKGMILAAGLGQRLKPITDHIPKPLVPILNRPNILYSIDFLRRHGIKEILINLFHLGDQIEKFLEDGRAYGVKVTYSKESVLLGTGGGVKAAESFFKGENAFLLINCDFICDFDISAPIQSHLEAKSLASMILYQNEAMQSRYAKVGTDPSGRLCHLGKHQTAPDTTTGIFTGIHILSPQCFSYLKPEPSGINEVLYPTLMKEHAAQVRGYFCKGLWLDTGEPKTILEATQTLLKKQGIPNLKGEGILLGEGASIGEGVIVGDHCQIGKGSSLKNTILMPHSKVPEHQKIEGVLWYQSTPIKA